MTSEASVINISETDTRSAADESTQLLEAALFEAKRVLVGQDRMIERLFVCWLARGPLPARRRARPGQDPRRGDAWPTSSAARSPASSSRPTSCPPTSSGTRIYRPSQEAFDVELGPIFANVVLADEINRAPAKVQSALLEVMAERHVSIGGVTYPVPEPFLVLATQNPHRERGRVPAARGAARPLPDEGPGRLPRPAARRPRSSGA